MMSPELVLLMFVCLQSARFCRAAPDVQTLNLKVEYGESAILPCNGSAYLGEEGSIHWETSMGEEVAHLQIGEHIGGESSKVQVELPSEEQLRRGDWSLLLRHTMLRDSGTYQCIWEGQRQGIVSTVWLSVTEPPTERQLTSYEGETVMLNCFLLISRSQTLSSLQTWWTRNGETVLSTEPEADLPLDSLYRFKVPFGTLEEFHLSISPTLLYDNGEYRCWYRTGDFESPRPGLPDRIRLTVLEKVSTATAAVTDDWLSSSNSPTVFLNKEWTESTTSSPDVIPVFLEDSTQPPKGGSWMLLSHA
ncbi:uncharacterized protein LOC117808058 [Xyrichtys novacula]|uniref:Uncharacterized protein LOC117808058 n=1 Tax=Xyrichtys novacula TaxID=13765 RepID=A0AAV1HR25_XYRNO|nr:uncharacterized protein LOC117808058 [Xyrichtys novacula]